jgi:hypothetical protein
MIVIMVNEVVKMSLGMKWHDPHTQVFELNELSSKIIKIIQ